MSSFEEELTKAADTVQDIVKGARKLLVGRRVHVEGKNYTPTISFVEFENGQWVCYLGASGDPIPLSKLKLVEE